MLLILGLFMGGLIGFATAAVLGAGKVDDLYRDRAYYQDECVKLRARLALEEIKKKEWHERMKDHLRKELFKEMDDEANNE